MKWPAYASPGWLAAYAIGLASWCDWNEPWAKRLRAAGAIP